jgi:hypothetical protein
MHPADRGPPGARATASVTRSIHLRRDPGSTDRSGQWRRADHARYASNTSPAVW